MKRICIAVMTILVAGISLPIHAEIGGTDPGSAPPAGFWKTIDDETHREKSVVEIWWDSGKLVGQVREIFFYPDEETKTICDKCPGERKDKPIVGMTIMWDLEKDGAGWSGGSILDPKNGKTYKCKLRLEDDGSKLIVRGYIGLSLIGRSQTWHRITEYSKQDNGADTAEEK